MESFEGHNHFAGADSLLAKHTQELKATGLMFLQIA
jgi:hypothetical protein